jgi:Alpha/beta hydrolase domain containing 18
MSTHLRSWMRVLGASLDHVYATTVHSGMQNKFFAKGWGDLSSLHRETFAQLLREVQQEPSHAITWKLLQSSSADSMTGIEYFEGSFTSPCAGGRLPGLPESCEQGKVWLARPKPTPENVTGMKACVIQLAATGEHTARCGACLLRNHLDLFVSGFSRHPRASNEQSSQT